MAYGSGATSWSITPAIRAATAVVPRLDRFRARRDRARSEDGGCGVLQTLGGQHHGRPSADARAGSTRTEADPRQLALALLAALEGGLLLAQIQRDPEPLAAALDAMLTLIATLSSTTSTSLNR